MGLSKACCPTSPDLQSRLQRTNDRECLTRRRNLPVGHHSSRADIVISIEHFQRVMQFPLDLTRYHNEFGSNGLILRSNWNQTDGARGCLYQRGLLSRLSQDEHSSDFLKF